MADRRTDRPSANRIDVNEADNLDLDLDQRASVIEDMELDERVADWQEQNRVNSSTIRGTLYKHEALDEKSTKHQIDSYEGIIPLRHAIGLEYGAGRYMLILSTGGPHKERKGTSYRFILHKSYDEKSRKFQEEKAKREREAMSLTMSPVPVPSLPAVSQAESFKDALTLVQGMFGQFMTMIQPIMTRAMSPAPVQSGIKGEIDTYSGLRDILRTMTKNDIAFFNQMKGSFMNPQTDTAEFTDVDDDGNPVQAPEDNKLLGLFERLVKIAEPFIPLLSQNSIAAKTAAAGIRAYPEVKQVIQQAQQNPAFVRKVIDYVKQKEGETGARNVLTNLGLNANQYIPPRLPAPAHPAQKKIIVKKVTKKK